jgi:uncharacterized membrane protein YphA (DoxX/SURF4 family)
MRIAVNLSRIIVGVLFIISGLVKANDPLGLSYKMQEFFEVWNSSLTSSSFFAKNFFIQSFNFLNDYSLALSIIMITLEIMAGVALLIGWRRKLILNLLFLLIVFFTFLTAYAYWSGKFKNCGCFGDCLPISPLTSFIKDVILLALILFLLIFQRHIQPIFSKKTQGITLLTSLLFTLGLQGYVLNYLPLADCLPFKKGASIPEKMKIPANAIQDSFAMKFVYEKEGKRFEFAPEQLPADLGNYKFIDRTQALVRKGNAEPPIKGFSLAGISGSDSTSAILQLPRALLLFCEYFKNDNPAWIEDFRAIKIKAGQTNIPVFIVTPDANAARQLFLKNNLSDVPIFSCDNIAVKTAARTNPTIFLIERGIVKEKYGYRQMERIIPPSPKGEQ